MCLQWGIFSYVFVSAIIYFSLPNIDSTKVVLKIGVVLYALVIGTMVHRAASHTFDVHPRKSSSYIVFAGAVVFMLSDTILAINRFITPLPYSRAVNISTYFAGISLLACSCTGGDRWAKDKQ